MNSFILKDTAREVVTCLKQYFPIGLSVTMEMFLFCDVQSGSQWGHMAVENVVFG